MSGGTSRRPSPREWLRGEPFPWPGIDELEEGVRVATCYGVESKQIARTKDDKPYLRLQLCDRSGSIEGRVWEDAERIDRIVEIGSFVGVRGRIQTFRNQRQLKIEEIAPIDVPAEDLDLFLPRTPLDLAALDAGLDELVASVSDPALRALLERLVGAETETGRAFRRAPAAKRNHHAYVGGLLEHTLSVARACDALARHYGDAVDRDLLVTGAILHDIGKVREIGVSIGFPYTDPGKLLGHIVLGIQMVRDTGREIPELTDDRLLLVLHLVASHQGKYEWQSPKIPMTLEALLLHYVDDLDAKMQQAMALVDAVARGWTAYDPSFGREFLRHRGAAPTDDVGEAFDPFGPVVSFDEIEVREASMEGPEGGLAVEELPVAEAPCPDQVTTAAAALEEVTPEHPPAGAHAPAPRRIDTAGQRIPATSQGASSSGSFPFDDATLDLFGS